MDFKILTDGINGQMTFDKATNIGNNVYLSLAVDKGSFFQNPGFGSRLYLLKRMKNTLHTAALAVDYCKEALAWLITAGKAVSVDVAYERDMIENPNRLKMQIEVTEANGNVAGFSYFVEVV